jgi:hypothetical protein
MVLVAEELLDALTIERPMAKKHPGRTGRPKSGADNKSVKFDRVLAGKAELIARDKGVTVAEYLNAIARAAIERDFNAIVKRTSDQ